MHFEGNKLTGISALIELKSLEYLNLSSNSIDDYLLIKFSKTLKELQNECHYDTNAIIDTVKSLLGKTLLTEV